MVNLAPATAPIPVAPLTVASRAGGIRRRHSALLVSLVVLVLLPLAVAAWYLYARAAPQFASTVAFSVRTEEFSSPVELFGGFADISSSGSSDADILFHYIASQEIVRRLDDRLGLAEIYAKADDPVFAFQSGGAIEALHDHWDGAVRVVYDPGTGLIEARALAFAPEDARAIAAGILDEASRLVDELSAIARDDATAFARAELDRSVARLKTARENVTAFRSRTQIVDPSADLQGQMGLLSLLEQQLAEALIDADLLRESTRAADPRLRQAERRIAVIEARIADERRKLGVGGPGGDGQDYATLLAEFERLAVDRDFAEAAYQAALAAFDQAQADARRKSRYVAAHVRPTLAETSEFPRREVILLTLAFFLFAGWALMVLVYYSVRDRR